MMLSNGGNSFLSFAAVLEVSRILRNSKSSAYRQASYLQILTQCNGVTREGRYHGYGSLIALLHSGKSPLV